MESTPQGAAGIKRTLLGWVVASDGTGWPGPDLGARTEFDDQHVCHPEWHVYFRTVNRSEKFSSHDFDVTSSSGSRS